MDFGIPALIANGQNVSDLTTPIVHPVFTGGVGPYTYVSGLPNNPGVIETNDEGGHDFSITLFNGSGPVEQVYYDNLIVRYQDSLGAIYDAQLPLGMLILAASVINLGQFPVSGTGVDSVTTNTAVVLPSGPPGAVFQMQADFNFQITSWIPILAGSIINGIISGGETGLSPPLNYAMIMEGTAVPPGTYYGLVKFLIRDTPFTSFYSTEISLATFVFT